MYRQLSKMYSGQMNASFCSKETQLRIFYYTDEAFLHVSVAVTVRLWASSQQTNLKLEAE